MSQKGVYDGCNGHVADVDFVVENELQKHIEGALEHRGRDK